MIMDMGVIVCHGNTKAHSFTEEQEVQRAKHVAALRVRPFQGVDGTQDTTETLPRIVVEHER